MSSFVDDKQQDVGETEDLSQATSGESEVATSGKKKKKKKRSKAGSKKKEKTAFERWVAEALAATSAQVRRQKKKTRKEVHVFAFDVL